MVEEPSFGKTHDETQDVEKLPMGNVPAVDHNSDGGAVDSSEKHTDGLSISRSLTRSIGPDQAEETNEPTRSKSQSQSVRSKAVTVIPRSKRRGLLGRLALIPEVARPPEYANKTKWLITLIVALAAAAAPMGSAILFRKSIYSCSSIALPSLGRVLIISSYPTTVISRAPCFIHSHESLRCIIYACHVYFPALVVFLF